MAATARRPGPAKGSRKIVFTPTEVTERRARVSELASLGKSDHAIGRILGVSKTTIAKDRRVLRIPARPPGQPPKSPLPEKRTCGICGKTFRPRRHNIQQGGGRFCSKVCMAQDPKRRGASREFVTALNEERARMLDRAKKDGDLLSKDEAAGELGVGPTSIGHYLRQGYLEAVRVAGVPGQSTPLLRREDVARFRKEWRRDDDPKRQTLRTLWLDPNFVVAVYRSRGIIERDAQEHRLSVEEMEVVHRFRVAQRARLYAGRRGRRQAAGPPEYHLVWAEQAEFWRAELYRQYQEKAELGHLEVGDHPPTDRDVYLAVAELDFGSNPERWPDYGHAPDDPHAIQRDFEKSAIDRVRKAVKALQIAATEIQ